MIREFVGRRGGSLLMMGGRRGLTDGGWGATSVAEVLPVRLPMLDGPSFVREPAKAKLTALGRTSAVTRLDADDKKNAELVGQHAGARGLPARRRSSSPAPSRCSRPISPARTEPLLVHQRYGLGNVYVLATGGTWRWQMQLPHEDQRHETFWRQLLQAARDDARRSRSRSRRSACSTATRAR